ncbi:MlaD family protein [Flavobacteriaceae bacterium]|nr:MlaD family protein [Flavobacteriaceae bacterium]MDB2427515.1 MlaD family protein [Flavobacteriaceae bacterium]MDB2684925.1 MlaD family protein [Flavobacteriaceae bacterium]MDC0331101.1 MlaD family protein [Flavobacteriaceae bacterium]MDC0636607.1 MlaD family protein [Flavobacteriaceae bacterium]
MSKELKTGVAAIIILCLGYWGFNFLKGQNLLEPASRVFYIEYDNIQGLNKASTVSINGLQVGKVTEIIFNKDTLKKGKLVVKIALDNDFEFSKNSVAKIYSTSIIGGESLAIIPSYEGELAVSGDYLKGEVESDIFTSVGETLNPLKTKVERVIIGADSLLIALNDVLDLKSRDSFKRTILGLETTISSMTNTLSSFNKMIDSTKVDIDIVLEDTKKITKNFVKVSDTLATVNLGQTVKTLQTTLANVNGLLLGIENGKGSLGKLATDDTMYKNLTNASRELEELLKEMKLNPKRFVHFSIFGKKAKPYTKEESKNNNSNE